MIITGHSADRGVKPNEDGRLEMISKFSEGAIEVDVRKRGGGLFLAHWLFYFASKSTPLEAAFEYCKRHNVKINLDVKEFGIIKDICELANKMEVGNLIYFTGRFMPSDMPYFTCGEAYVNEEFFVPSCGIPTIKNLERITKFLNSFGCERLKGINTGYRKISAEYMAEAKRLGLGLSLYTVNTRKALERVVALEPDNITTSYPLLAKEVAEKFKGENK